MIFFLVTAVAVAVSAKSGTPGKYRDSKPWLYARIFRLRKKWWSYYSYYFEQVISQEGNKPSLFLFSDLDPLEKFDHTRKYLRA